MNPPALKAATVHLLTASGAALGLLALEAAHRGDWQRMFAWLGLSLVVDGIDGPLARRFDTAGALPRWSGDRLDLIVDYLTYVVVPAFALTQAALLPQGWRLIAAIAVLLSSLFHFADTKSKTKSGYFVGFPAIWSLVCFYLFVFEPQPVLALCIVAGLIVLTFVPLLYVHPVRTHHWRAANIAAMALWVIGAVCALLYPFPSPPWIKGLLGATAAYLLLGSLVGSWRARGDAA
jgi:phosphatidylcholine synthase